MQYENRIIPKKMYIGEDEVLDEEHLCVIIDMSDVLIANQKQRIFL